MSLIHDIQAEAIGGNARVGPLLRKCKLLAARLDHAKLAEWVDWELNGYPDGAVLPGYREVNVPSYGSFAGFGMNAPKLQISLSVLPEAIRENYRVARLDQAISTYENLVEGKKPNAVQVAWPIALAVKYGSKITSEMQCISACQELPIAAIDRLLDAVRNAVLGYAIEIEKLTPDAGELPMGTKPISEDKLTQIFYTQIGGNVGNLANGGQGNSQQVVVNAGAGDWEALRKALLASAWPMPISTVFRRICKRRE